MPDRRHLLVLVALAAVALVAALMSLTVTPWALLALPLCLVGSVGAWLGMSLDSLSEAIGFAEEDPARGPAGMLP